MMVTFTLYVNLELTKRVIDDKDRTKNSGFQTSNPVN